MPGIVTNTIAQQQQGAAQAAGLSSQIYQQNLWDAVMQQYLGLAGNPTAQNTAINWMTGQPSVSSGSGTGMAGNLSNAMSAVAGTVPGSSGTMSPAVMNMVMGQFQQPLYNASSGLYYNALKNALGVNVPTVGSHNQMQIGNGSNEFASGIGSGIANSLVSF